MQSFQSRHAVQSFGGSISGQLLLSPQYRVSVRVHDQPQFGVVRPNYIVRAGGFDYVAQQRTSRWTTTARSRLFCYVFSLRWS